LRIAHTKLSHAITEGGQDTISLKRAGSRVIHKPEASASPFRKNLARNLVSDFGISVLIRVVQEFH
jgi:hypothetical protein